MVHPFIKDQNERHLHYAFEDINRILRGLPDSAEINLEEFNSLRNKLSRRKLLANRKNAKKSTGPKTEAGKKRSSKNAIQHGLTAQSDITSIMLEYDGEFNAFQDKMFWQFAPKSEAETLLVDRIVTLAWRLKRIPLMETRMIDWHCKEDAPHAALMWGEARSFVNLSRYEGQLDRSLHRTFKKLEELQAHRNVDHFATRTKAMVEVEMARERALDQETRRAVARLQKGKREKPEATHSKADATDLSATSHRKATAKPSQSHSKAQKSETNPPNLKQVQDQTSERGDLSDMSDQSDSLHASLATVHAPRKSSDKPQATSDMLPPMLIQFVDEDEEVASSPSSCAPQRTVADVSLGAEEEGAGDGGPKNEAPQSSIVNSQSSILPPLFIKFVDEDESDSSDKSDLSDSPHEPRATDHAPRNSGHKPQATSHIFPNAPRVKPLKIATSSERGSRTGSTLKTEY
jgi:hypothetical protein